MSSSLGDDFNIGSNKKPAFSLPQASSKGMFGAPTSGLAPTSSGANTTSSTGNLTTPSLSFGAGNSTSSGFSFGSSASTSTGFGLGGASTTAASKPAFGAGSSFGASTTTTPAFGTGAAFGATTTSAAPTFGAGSTLGASTTTTPAFGTGSTMGATTTSAAPAFGTGTAFGTTATSKISTFGYGNVFGSVSAASSTAPAFGSSSSFLGSSSAFKSNSFSLGATSSSNSGQGTNGYPNLSVSYSATDLKYAEQKNKAFCLTQEHRITPDTLVNDLPQDAKNFFSQIEKFRTKEIENKASLIGKMRSMAPSLGFIASDNDMCDSPLPVDDKIDILLKELKNLKLKLQKDDAIAKEAKSCLETNNQQGKKVQQKFFSINAQHCAVSSVQNPSLLQMGNIPFTQLMNSFSGANSFEYNKSSFADVITNSGYDGLDYFIQLYTNLQTQSVFLKAELLKIQNAVDGMSFGDPPSQQVRDELIERISVLSKQEMNIRLRLFSALQAANINYPLNTKKTADEDILGLGNILFQQHYVPKEKQDDVLFEIANVELKPADLSKLKRK